MKFRHTFGRRLRAAGVSLEDRQGSAGARGGKDHDALQRGGDRELGNGG